MVSRPYINANNILTTGHNLLCCFVTKANNTLKHTLLVLDIVLISKLKSLLKVVYAKYMALLLHHLFGKHTTSQ